MHVVGKLIIGNGFARIEKVASTPSVTSMLRHDCVYRNGWWRYGVMTPDVNHMMGGVLVRSCWCAGA